MSHQRHQTQSLEGSFTHERLSARSVATTLSRHNLLDRRG